MDCAADTQQPPLVVPPFSTYSATNDSSMKRFNPFNYDASNVRTSQSVWASSSVASSSSSSPTPNPSRSNSNHNNIISLRSIQMKQIMNELLYVVPDDIKIQLILQKNQEFLLEPLEEDDAVQDLDSIYYNCTNRIERYITFQQSMIQRLHTVKDPSVRHILQAYNHFILSPSMKEKYKIKL